MITQRELKEVLDYDPTTGVFTWIKCKARCIEDGSVAGTISKSEGYIRIGLNCKLYRAHRLAFLYMMGYLPEHQVDHVNGIRDDNRWDNLRHVTMSCNLQNQKVRSTNKSGFPGVYYDKSSGKYRVGITINSREVYLGRYDTALEAALVRYTVEVQCSKWVCNYRSELALAIGRVWPEFNSEMI